MWYRHKDTQADQRNRIEDAVINPHRCGEKIFNRGPRPLNAERTLSPTNCVLRKLDIHMQENEFRPLGYIIYKN